MASVKRPQRGALIVEAVVAAFLMVFAFAASTSLFHAALQWESQGGNVRKAALVAEKKIGEIRAWSEDHHATHSFDDGWVAPITGVQTDYPEAPGFAIEVIADQPTYEANPVTTETPPDGMYGPTSHFYVPPPFGVNPTYLPPALPADFENAQKSPFYGTFSRVRTFNASFRRVQVIVRYGNDQSREFRAVTLVGDPITRSTGGAPVITIARLAGPANISQGNPADYGVTVEVAGHVIDDVVCLWGVHPLSTGAVFVKPKDSNGREVRVSRPTFGNAGSTRLAVRLRYRGREYTTFSDPINVI